MRRHFSRIHRSNAGTQGYHSCGTVFPIPRSLFGHLFSLPPAGLAGESNSFVIKSTGYPYRVWYMVFRGDCRLWFTLLFFRALSRQFMLPTLPLYCVLVLYSISYKRIIFMYIPLQSKNWNLIFKRSLINTVNQSTG